MSTYIEGLRETVRNLEKVGVDVQDLKEVFTDIGRMVANDASVLAPRKSGRLAASIRPTKTKNKAAVRAGSARVPYAGVQNYGWPKRHIGGKNFLQRAINANESKAVRMMEDGLGRIIKQYK